MAFGSCRNDYISDVARPNTSAHGLQQLSKKFKRLHVVSVFPRLSSSNTLHLYNINYVPARKIRREAPRT